MKTLGITGGIGSGKSTVCRILEDLGARVFYADMEAKQLMQDHEEVRTEIIEAFGPESYTTQGKLDRGFLAQKVFQNEEQVNRINRIVHPRVFEAFEQEKRKAEREGIDLLVEEAALIFESGADQHLDAVAVVDAPPEIRIERVVERDQVPEAHIRARMAHQLPPEILRQRADFVIENTGSLEDLRMQVERLYMQMVGERE